MLGWIFKDKGLKQDEMKVNHLMRNGDVKIKWE